VADHDTAVLNQFGKKITLRFVKDSIHHECKNGRFKEQVILEWVRSLKLKGVYIDAGAHIGNHAVFFMLHCPSTFVYAFEAHPRVGDLLRENIKDASTIADKNARVIMGGVWDIDGVLLGMTNLPPKAAGTAKIDVDGPVIVQSVTIDRFVNVEDDRVVVLKMDVEHSENRALRGAIETVRRDRPLVLAEHHTKDQVQEFTKQLQDLDVGYRQVKHWPGVRTYAFAPKGML
jgi:FkbM family methyltransferase